MISSFSTSGCSNSSRSCAHRSASGSARRSTTNSTQPLPGVGDGPTPAAGAAAGRPRRRGFHSASSATTFAAARERRRETSTEDPPPMTRESGGVLQEDGFLLEAATDMDPPHHVDVHPRCNTEEADRLAAIASERGLPRSLPLIISKEQGQRLKELSPMFSEE